MKKLSLTHPSVPHLHGFTLPELLTVIGILALLFSLLVPALEKTRSTAKRTLCLNNLKQVGLAVRLYADDHGEAIQMPARARATQYDFHLFKEQVKSYASLNGPPSHSERLFACPSDTFSYAESPRPKPALCQQAGTDFTSYAFNGMNYRGTNSETGKAFPGIAGIRLSSIRQPDKTALVCEASALTPYSWHWPLKPDSDYRFQDSRNVLGFVDGHAGEVRIYWNGKTNSEAWHYDPPAGYSYKWSAE